MSTLILDIEVFHGFFYAAVKRTSDGARFAWEMSEDHPVFDTTIVRNVLMRNTIVTFNGLAYDLPLLWYVIKGATTEQAKEASDHIIKHRIRWWQVEEFLGIKIPREINHIDLIEPQPNAFASLKTLNGRLHGRRLQDLPYDPDHVPNRAERAKIADYCRVSDLDATENLFVALKEPLDLRRALSRTYREDFRSKSDSQIGERIIKKRVQQATGLRAVRVAVPGGATFKYEPPSWLTFQTPQLQALLDHAREIEFRVQGNGKVALPASLSVPMKIGPTTYKIGIGGLHSADFSRSVKSDATHALIDADVAGQYPRLILLLGLVPPALGPAFLNVYSNIMVERLAAKRAKDKAKDKGLKIALNGSYGKLGSPYSVLYAPHLMIAVTLTGQLSLLMLIERAYLAGIPVVSGNTDGVVFHCPREKYAGLDGDRLVPSALEAVTSAWEKDTGCSLEFNEYSALYNQSVNSYFAIKMDGGHKRKGPLANPWCDHPDDYDPRALLMKNPQNTICSDAALAFIKDGTSIEDTIHECDDIRQFVTVIKADGGATWRDEYLGKTVRFYWAEDGDPIIKVKAHASTGIRPKVPGSDGCRPCMDLPDEIPDDLDHARYVEEAKLILVKLGFHGDLVRPKDRIRLTKVNKARVLSIWMIAA